MMNPAVLRQLFTELKNSGYEWQPQTPDRLLKFRKEPATFRPLVQWLGLGLSVAEKDLIDDGLSQRLLHALIQEKFSMAVSGSGEMFIVHDHWPPSASVTNGYVHYAAESAWLARECNRDLEGFIDKRVLDLGCSSGALSLEVAAVAKEVMGIDISERSIAWARTQAAAYGINSIRFEHAAIGEKSAELAVGSEPWDVVVMNPPMVVPSSDAAYPHRDGGKLGIELPLLFIEFAAKHLRSGGEVLTFATNPIVKGRPAFFDSLNRKHWEVVEKRLLTPHFNQTVARKQGYAEQGIANIELLFLHLKRLP